MQRELLYSAQTGNTELLTVYFLRELRRAPSLSPDPWAPLDALQGAKGRATGIIAQRMQQMMPKVPIGLKDALGINDVTYVLAPPSRFAFAADIARALAAHYGAEDLTGRVTKRGGQEAIRATSGVSAAELLSTWNCDAIGVIKQSSKVLLVDDVVASGETFRSLAHLVLSRAPDSSITCCAALSVDPSVQRRGRISNT